MKTKDTEALGRQKAKPSRSKPNSVDQPIRTARTIVLHYNGTHRDSNAAQQKSSHRPATASSQKSQKKPKPTYLEYHPPTLR